MQSQYFEEELPEHIQNYIENFEVGGPKVDIDSPRKDSDDMEFEENMGLELVAPKDPIPENSIPKNSTKANLPRRKIFDEEPPRSYPVHSLKTSKKSYRPKAEPLDPTTMATDQSTIDSTAIVDEELSNLRTPGKNNDQKEAQDLPPHRGNTYCYWFDEKTGAPRIVWGPNWPFTICVVC
jgi:hypothetical protein